MLAQLFTLLNGATGAGSNVFPQISPDGTVSPYITYSRISAQSNNVLSGTTSLINTRVQIDVYANTYALAQSIATQVDGLMASWVFQNVSNPQQDIYEAEVRLFRVLLDYSVWHS
jgi:hypothetical protein